jgi:hypothetical protein
VFGLRSTARPAAWLTTLLLALFLGTMLAGWAHAAEHAGEPNTGDGCHTCQWIKHSPATTTTIDAPVVRLVALPGPDAQPSAPYIRLAVTAPTGRAPPLVA